MQPRTDFTAQSQKYSPGLPPNRPSWPQPTVKFLTALESTLCTTFCWVLDTPRLHQHLKTFQRPKPREHPGWESSWELSFPRYSLLQMERKQNLNNKTAFHLPFQTCRKRPVPNFGETVKKLRDRSSSQNNGNRRQRFLIRRCFNGDDCLYKGRSLTSLFFQIPFSREK